MGATDEPNRFTADDVIAVTFLSVTVPAFAAQELLDRQSAKFTDLLVRLGHDRDLADEDADVDDPEWAGWAVMKALRDLDGVGPTTASKLLARKRPKLRPIWDSIVADLTDTHDNLWNPLRLALRADNKALQSRLTELRSEAGVSERVSAIRVFDVVAWMEGIATRKKR